MDWLKDLFVEQSAIQAVIVVSLISCVGIMLGKVKFGGVSLGATFVFFVGILAGHLGLAINQNILLYIESFGLALFVYALGLQVGPGFFNSLRSGGIKIVTLATSCVLLGTLLSMALLYVFNIPISDMAGILCGATANTPALGAAQQTLKQLNINSTNVALAGAVTYPLGILGVYIALYTVKKFFVRPSDIQSQDPTHKRNIYIAEFRLTNPDLFGKSIQEIAPHSHHRFVISRIWRRGKVSIPTSKTEFHKSDRILVTTSPTEIEFLTQLFGKQVDKDWNTENIDWNSIDSQLISQIVLVTRSEINGKKLSSLRLRNNHGINISRVTRSGIQLLPTPDLVLQLGDRLVIVGEAKALHNVAKILGNGVKNLSEPNLATVFIGLIIGLIVGSIPFAIPGMSVSVQFGIAGGSIISGILIGTFGPRLHMITYTTRSANLMLRALGLSMFLACVGLNAGKNFFEIILQPQALLWLLLGFVITYLPVVVIAVISLRVSKLDFGTTAGIMCGSMANPMALDYINNTVEGDQPAVSYATVYPICMFLRVVIIQIILILFL